MSISCVKVGENLPRIEISGRLNTSSTDSIAARVVELAAASKGVVIGLDTVRFLASIGIRAPISSAKAVQDHGEKRVLVVDDGSAVRRSLEAIGVAQLIPVITDSSDAEKAAVA